ncbi:hypothetical protein L1887_47795 [Cichorium endivia]|nr:hypothetical protein L1887_47795 [Cichorium endivia]
MLLGRAARTSARPAVEQADVVGAVHGARASDVLLLVLLLHLVLGEPALSVAVGSAAVGASRCSVHRKPIVVARHARRGRTGAAGIDLLLALGDHGDLGGRLLGLGVFAAQMLEMRNRHGVELAAHVLATHALAGHDERAADVAVLDEALAVRHAEVLGELQRRDARGVGHGDHDVDRLARLLQLAAHLVGELVAHGHARAVDRDAVHDAVGAGKVDVLEDVGREGVGVGRVGGRREDATRHGVLGDDDRLAGLDVLKVLKAKRVADDRLGGEAVVLAVALEGQLAVGGGRRARAHAERTDAVGVAEGDDAETSKHGDAGVAALALLHEVANGGEDVLLVDAELARLLQVVGKDVEEHLRVRIGVDVTVGVGIEEATQLVGVDEVAVVGEGDAVGRVDVEGLRLRVRRGAGGGVSNVADAHVSLETRDGVDVKDIADHAVRLALVEAALVAARHDTGGILTAVLEERERLVDLGRSRLVDRGEEECCDATHDATTTAAGPRVRWRGERDWRGGYLEEKRQGGGGGSSWIAIALPTRIRASEPNEEGICLDSIGRRLVGPAVAGASAALPLLLPPLLLHSGSAQLNLVASSAPADSPFFSSFSLPGVVPAATGSASVTPKQA